MDNWQYVHTLFKTVSCTVNLNKLVYEKELNLDTTHLCGENTLKDT